MTESGEATKSKVQLKKEQKKEAKLAKFAEKQTKLKDVVKTTKTKAPKEISIQVVEPIKDKDGKKDTNQEMPNSYSPKYVEAFWYDWWEKAGYFKPEYHSKMPNKKKEKFTIVIPPPNVTGNLHLGHALTNSIEDSIVRWNRMSGRETLWLPGSDHAGIATQVVVEKKVMREEKITRHELGREKFLERVWQWKEEKGSRIYDQLRALGSSCDWSRARFTMDPCMSTAVCEAFITLHQKGLIYRTNRLVNWSCTLNSAISDIEVDKVELTGKTFLSVPGYEKKVAFGIITSFAYPIIGDKSNSEIIVATTRIETMVGDTGIAVHPDDPRYKSFVGKFAQHPFITDRKIPIIADTMVDMEFGTGAVKLTPAHDQNDWEAGLRNKLEVVNILNEDGTLNDNAGQFKGLKRFDARMAVLKALEEKKLLRREAENPMVVPMCSRTKDIIEPLLKPQWYLKCQGMADRSVEAVNKGDLKIYPQMYEKTWFGWLTDCHDWCISRQLWWGHRIPAYVVSTRKSPSDPWVRQDANKNESWVSGRTKEEALENAKKAFSVKNNDLIKLDQDEDVLDTWFSSALFPFASMGWPNTKAPDFEKYFPGSLLETGHDILFFWVARMVMMSLQFFDKLPFHTIYLHSMVRDAHGKKMSKSLGNAIDPVDVINGISLPELHHQLEIGNLDPKELDRAKAAQSSDFPSGIPECGTDALRFALCAYVSQGRNINLDILRVQGYRFFCNKLWNAAKFALYHCLGEKYIPPKSPTSGLLERKTYANLHAMDKWILARCQACMDKCDTAFKTYMFNDATTACYNFWLYELCDIYLEYSKPKTKKIVNNELVHLDDKESNRTREVLYFCLKFGLAMLHPFMPFITEELYQRLTKNETNPLPSISISPYPLPADYIMWTNEESARAEEALHFAMSIVRGIRYYLNEYKITGKNLDKCEIQLLFNDTDSMKMVSDTDLHYDIIEAFLKCKVVRMTTDKSDINQNGCINSTVFATEQTGAKDENVRYCIFYLNLMSLVNIEEEKAKLDKKQKILTTTLDNIVKETQKPGYETKVPLVKREANDKKLSEIKTEISQIHEMMTQYDKFSAANPSVNSCCKDRTSSSEELLKITQKKFSKLSINGPNDVLHAWLSNKEYDAYEKSQAMQWLNLALYPNGPSEFLKSKGSEAWLQDHLEGLLKNEAASVALLSMAKNHDKIKKRIQEQYKWI